MPLYDHRCEHCSAEFEDFRKIADFDKLPGCPECGAPGCPQVVGSVKIGGVSWAPTEQDNQTAKHYGVNKNTQVHQSYMTGEVLKFDKGDKKAQEKIRQHYIKNGVKEAEDAGSVRLRNK